MARAAMAFFAFRLIFICYCFVGYYWEARLGFVFAGTGKPGFPVPYYAAGMGWRRSNPKIIKNVWGRILASRVEMGENVFMLRIASERFEVETRGKGLYEVTARLEKFVVGEGIWQGQVTVFVRHTSASLVIMENADPSARRDLELYFERLVPEDTAYFEHTEEGADDMPSHIRMALTRTCEVIPVVDGRLVLGTWQGVFLFEHRRRPHRRQIVMSLVGEG